MLSLYEVKLVCFLFPPRSLLCLCLWSVMMGYYLGSHLPVRELQQGSYCPDNGLLGDQDSVLALGYLKIEKEACPESFFFFWQERFIPNDKVTQTHISAVISSTKTV